MLRRTITRRTAATATSLILTLLILALACGPADSTAPDSRAVGLTAPPLPNPARANADTPTPGAPQDIAIVAPSPTANPANVAPTAKPAANQVVAAAAVPPATSPTAIRQSTAAVNTDPCRAIVAAVGRPIAPYVFGRPAASSDASGVAGASGAAREPDPTITVVEFRETISMQNPDFYPPTVENMTLFHDVVAHGVAAGRTDLLYSADGRNFVYGFVNFRVTEYLKGSGPEYICVTDRPEREPYHRLYVGKEYIVMLVDHANLGGGLHSDAYMVSDGIGWQVDGSAARLMPSLPEPWRTVITSDRRVVDEFWLTPEPNRAGLGESTNLSDLKQRIKAAVSAESP